MGAPKITITCDCGEERRVDYGEQYACSCGRSWSTSSIPTGDYDAIRRLDRTFRTKGWVALTVIGALLLFISLTHPSQLLVAAPGLMLVWFTGLRPFVRRRHWRRVQALTRSWNLKPERKA